MNKTSTPTLFTLQALRALAAFLVLFYHATQFLTTEYGVPFFGFFLFGFSGVHIFFVLSGFIIFITNYKNIGKTSSFILYILKRFIRIYPIYWFVLLPIFFLKSNLDLDFGNIYNNLILYNMPFSYYNPIAWTLTFELWFYLLLGIIILNRWIGVAVFVFWIAGIFYEIITGSSPVFLPSFIFHKYSSLFLIGMLVSYIAIKSVNLKPIKKQMLSRLSIFVGGGGFLVTSFYVLLLDIKAWDTWVITLGYGVGSGFLMLSCLSNKAEKFFKNSKFIVFAGNASYSLYLIHYIMLELVAKLFHKYYANSESIALSFYMILVCVFIVLFSFILHKIIESPLNIYLRAKLLSK